MSVKREIRKFTVLKDESVKEGANFIIVFFLESSPAVNMRNSCIIITSAFGLFLGLFVSATGYVPSSKDEAVRHRALVKQVIFQQYVIKSQIITGRPMLSLTLA